MRTPPRRAAVALTGTRAILSGALAIVVPATVVLALLVLALLVLALWCRPLLRGRASCRAGGLMRDVRELRVRWPDYEFAAGAGPFPVDAIPPPPSYPDPVYLYLPGRGSALVSDAIDRGLAGPGLDCELADGPYRLPGPLRASVPFVLPVCNRGRLVFNGQVVGMRDDPLPPASGAEAPIRLHVARFFDTQCSNDLCALRITRPDTGEDFDPRRTLLTSADGHLRSLAESVLADPAGVSTLAVTADGALVLVRQSRHNAASPRLLAPSGSGSLDPRDLGRGRTGTLQAVLRRGMDRELCEETGIRPDEIRNTAVLGFARWLERGAKPEFFGFTELSASAEDLAGRGPLVPQERLYSGGTLTVRIDLDALGRELANGAELLTAPSLPRRIREEGSLPLLLSLRAAALARARRAPAVSLWPGP